MKLITSPAELSSTFDRLLRACDAVSFAVAWASRDFPACKRLLRSRGKIRHAVVGTHFHQTAPDFIAEFVGEKQVRFVLDHSGVFHPKLYLFERSDGWDCIVGSANFTSGGFGANAEACLLVSDADDPSGTTRSDARKAIERHWRGAQAADKIDLDRYRYWRDRFKRSSDEAAGRFGEKKSGRALEEIDLLHIDWADFFAKVRRDRHHGLKLRIAVLERARDLFNEHGRLAAMPLKDRQGVAGFLESGDVPWGWFGSMKGAGVFKNLVNRDPEGLSDALDEIPLQGRVSEDDYKAFVNRFVGAFPVAGGRPTRHGLGTATRLLAMKRPDYFVCLDKANRSGLCDAFEVSMHHHDYDAYWDAIVERVLVSKWWNARCPKEPNAAEVWRGRAAFLDALYFEPV